jgi:hypothetical protein
MDPENRFLATGVASGQKPRRRRQTSQNKLVFSVFGVLLFSRFFACRSEIFFNMLRELVLVVQLDWTAVHYW